MIFQNFMFKIDGKNMKNEKIPKLFFHTIFIYCLKTSNPGSFCPAHAGNLIIISISEIHFRDFPLYSYWICLPGSWAENLVSPGNYCRRLWSSC